MWDIMTTWDCINVSVKWDHEWYKHVNAAQSVNNIYIYISINMRKHDHMGQVWDTIISKESKLTIHTIYKCCSTRK